MYRVRKGLITWRQFQKQMSYDTYCKFIERAIFYHKLNCLDRPYSKIGLEKNIREDFEQSSIYANLRLTEPKSISCFDYLAKLDKEKVV